MFMVVALSSRLASEVASPTVPPKVTVPVPVTASEPPPSVFSSTVKLLFPIVRFTPVSMVRFAMVISVSTVTDGAPIELGKIAV